VIATATVDLYINFFITDLAKRSRLNIFNIERFII